MLLTLTVPSSLPFLVLLLSAILSWSLVRPSSLSSSISPSSTPSNLSSSLELNPLLPFVASLSGRATARTKDPDLEAEDLDLEAPVGLEDVVVGAAVAEGVGLRGIELFPFRSSFLRFLSSFLVFHGFSFYFFTSVFT